MNQASNSQANRADPEEIEERADELVRRNVRTIAQIEEAAREERTRSDRIADAITGFCGSLKFVTVHALAFGLWIAVNVSPFEELRFDPYPFGLLTLWVSMEAIFLATFILITQNRQGRLADRRNHLNLQFSMLAEQEITKTLEIVQDLQRRAGAPAEHEEVEALKQATEPERVADHIDRYVRDATGRVVRRRPGAPEKKGDRAGPDVPETRR